MNWNAADEISRTAPDADDAIESNPDASIVISELVALDRIAYGQRRRAAADALGVTVSILDKAVEDQKRAQRPQEMTAATIVEIIEPWDMPVDGLTIAEDIRAERFGSSFSRAIATPMPPRPGLSEHTS